MRVNKHKLKLPIGRTARLAFQLEALRGECCQAAETVMRRKQIDEMELEECARLDDSLAAAHRLLRRTIAQITLARLKRRSQAR